MYYFNKIIVHSGKGMNITILDKLKLNLEFKHLLLSFINFPIIILDYYSVDFFLEYDKLSLSFRGQNLLAQDYSRSNLYMREIKDILCT